MSFVSTIATTKYITIVTDGKVSYEDSSLNEEKYQKFIKINNNLFVGYAGEREPCEAFIQESKLLGVTNWESKDLSRYLNKKMDCSRYKTNRILLILGGINKRNKIEFFTFKTALGGCEIEYYSPTKKISLNYAFLFNSMNGNININLENKLSEFINITGYDTPDNAIKAQIMLNNFVADNDDSANKEIFKMFINK